MLSLATFGAGFLTRPIGGLVIGAYADRVGRRPAMMLSYVMMGCAIVGLALIPSYRSIGIAAPILAVAARLLQGFSLGGEVGSNTAFLLEAAPPRKRGLVVAWQGASQDISATAGSLVGLALSAVLSGAMLDAYGWRIAFLLGALTVPFGLLLRRTMPETLHAPDHDPPPAEAASPGREALRVGLLGLLMLGGGTICTYVLDYMTTFAQSALHMSARVGFASTLGVNIVGAITILLGGWASDRWGRRPVMIWPQILYCALALPVFLLIAHVRSPLVIIAGPMLLAAVGAFAGGAYYAALCESMPKQLRGRGFATMYATAIAIFGGTAQPLATWMIHATGKPEILGVFLMAATLMTLAGMLLIRESAPVRRAA
jgi:MFS family permease